jgi:hypothetical protein
MKPPGRVSGTPDSPERCVGPIPKTGIVFVFLSNRVNPDAENKKIQDLNIRTEIQSALYRAFGFKNRRQR